MNGVTMTLDGHILTISGAARVLECSEQTARKYADSGKLPSVRAGNGVRLFRESDVKDLAAKLEQSRGE